jgi:low temperature requirement protein LtrA
MVFSRPLRLRSRDGREPGRKVTWLELFFDLVFVAAVSQVGAPLGQDYTLAGLGRYAMLFVLIWWAWHGHTAFATRFDTDDVVQRALTLVQMFVVAVMAVNAKDALSSKDSAGFAAAYAVMRFVLVAQYGRARTIVESRAMATACVVCFGIAASLWLASAWTPAPIRFWLWGAALIIDFSTPLITSRHLAQAPPDAAHLPERFGLFTIILIGEAMVGVMHGMESQKNWTPSAFTAALMGMATLFALWWAYFDGVRGAEERLVKTADDARRFQIWTYAHLPLYLGIGITGVGVYHVIALATAMPLNPEESWVLCGGLAVVMAAMTTIGGAGAPSAHHQISTGRLMALYALAAIAAMLGAVGSYLPPAGLIVALAGLCITQLAVSVRSSSAARQLTRLEMDIPAT